MHVMVSEKSKNRNSTLAEKFHIDDHKPKNNKTENGLAEGWRCISSHGGFNIPIG